MSINLLRKLGFSDKHISVYHCLLKIGPTSVRKLADHSGINRGTAYDILRWLQDQGLVNYYHQDKRQLFMAEDPARLHKMVKNRQEELHDISFRLDHVVPELAALYNREGERPVVRYFDTKGLKMILDDVLDTCADADEKLYRIYSATELTEFLYQDFPDFSDKRIQMGIEVRAISISEGGVLRGLDQRKWLERQEYTVPTYILIYAGKTAYISLNNAGEPIGVVIDNQGVYQTQKMIFDSLWAKL